MPPVPSLTKLPDDIRAALHRRLAADGFGNLVATAEWLTSEGHPIKRSALHEYARRHRAEIEAELLADQATAGATDLRRAEIRLRVMELAAAEPGDGDLLARSERLLAWVEQG